MKTDIHPKYNKATKVKCACGKVFTLGSTQSEISVEICSNCHPFYIGKERLVDTAGKVEKFKARRAKASSKPKTSKKVKRAAKGKKAKAKK